jgi:hypothetical protein
MISRATADALARVAERAAEMRHAYEAGFEPAEPSAASSEVAPARTLDPLSVVAPGGAYFVVGGAGGARLTRDGGFALAPNGKLHAHDGSAVLGFARDGAPLAPLRIDAVDAALGRARDVRLERDGSLSYVRTALDPRTGTRRNERLIAGRLALAAMPAGTGALHEDATHAAPPPGTTATYGRPGEGAFAFLTTHARDRGRLDPIAGVRRLQEAYVALEALHAAGYAGDSLDRAALDLVK